MEVGLNLYSIRNFLQTEKDFLSTALKLKDAGYAYMQYSGGVFDPAMIARVSKESGMPICLTHMPMDRILNDTEKLMEEHAVFGCKNIGLGAMPPQVLCKPEEFKQTVEKLNDVGEKMLKNGFKFFYHHHHYEFFRTFDGVTAIEYILKNAPYINFTADTYWMQYGGVDVAAFLEKMKGRIGCVHLKDYRIAIKSEENGWVEYAPQYAPLGEGNMDFKAIVESLKKAGTEYYLVEQDDAADYPDPMGEVLRSIEYVKKEL